MGRLKEIHDAGIHRSAERWCPHHAAHRGQPERPGPTRREPRRAQRSYTTPRDTILATALVRENAALERENATLRDRIAELERSAALDSTTSSKPPASDGLRKKSGTQRRTRSQRGKSGRPSGGQPGHKGTTLARTESPDHVVDHDPSACSGCGAPLSDADRHRAPVCRQVFDVPAPRPLEVTEHRAHRCLCGACATVTGAVFPTA